MATDPFWAMIGDMGEFAYLKRPRPATAGLIEAKFIGHCIPAEIACIVGTESKAPQGHSSHRQIRRKHVITQNYNILLTLTSQIHNQARIKDGKWLGRKNH